jgi:hypothetical protein
MNTPSLAGLLVPPGPREAKVGVARARQSYVPPTQLVGASGEPAFQNGWVASPGLEPVGFVKTSDGFVRLTGVAGNPAAPGGQQTVFTLPVNYRPDTLVLFPVFEWGRDTDSFGNRVAPYLEPYLLVHPDGRLLVEAAGSVTLMLNGRRFQAAN